MDGYYGEVRAFAFDYAPENWAICNGQLMPLLQNQALAAVIGTRYGGDGKQTIGLPNLMGRAVLDAQSPSLVAATQGSEGVVLNGSQMGPHTHKIDTGYAATAAGDPASVTAVAAGLQAPIPTNKYYHYYTYATASNPPAAMNTAIITPAGVAAPAAHENRQPYLTLNFCICINGEFPIHD